MNVLVFTSSMIDSHFASYQSGAKIKPNPSNQNFYSKLIKCLAINNNVSVVSLRPLSKGMFKQRNFPDEVVSSGTVTYYYSKINSSKFYKIAHEKNDIIEMAKKAIEDFHSNDFIIVTDTLRYNLLKAARKIAQQYNVKIVGMLTDNPDNLSSVNRTYSLKIKENVRSLDGYLALSAGLVEAFNSEKPSYVFEGLVQEENVFKKDPIYDYYFFGGSLYERYGVKTLIEAFHKSNIKSKLVLAGSGPLDKYIEEISNDDYRILYLAQLPKDKIIGYELNAIANINPRPLNSSLDNESVPSKFLEYVSLGVPVISTKFPKFYTTFKDDLNWIEGNDVDSMVEALEKFDSCDKNEAKKKASIARLKIFEFYGLNVQSESIDHFLASINSSNN